MRTNTKEKLPGYLAAVSDVGTVGRPKTRKPKPGEAIQISVTFDGAFVLALDEEAERIAAERPGMTLTRADVIRIGLHEWLALRAKRTK